MTLSPITLIIPSSARWYVDRCAAWWYGDHADLRAAGWCDDRGPGGFDEGGRSGSGAAVSRLHVILGDRGGWGRGRRRGDDVVVRDDGLSRVPLVDHGIDERLR